jgi:hypothetical protein
MRQIGAEEAEQGEESEGSALSTLHTNYVDNATLSRGYGAGQAAGRILFDRLKCFRYKSEDVFSSASSALVVMLVTTLQGSLQVMGRCTNFHFGLFCMQHCIRNVPRRILFA